MPVYSGTIQMQGDPNRLPAVITVDDGRIIISSRSNPIGNWTLHEAGFRRAPDGVVLTVEEGSLLMQVDNVDSLARAVGLREGDQPRRRSAYTQPHPSEKKDEFESQSRSAEEVARDIAADLDPYVSDVKEGLSQINLTRNQWIGVGVGVLAAFILPSISVILLTIVGTVALLAGGAAIFEPSIESRFPEELTPARVIAIGLACMLLAFLVLAIRG